MYRIVFEDIDGFYTIFFKIKIHKIFITYYFYYLQKNKTRNRLVHRLVLNKDMKW